MTDCPVWYFWLISITVRQTITAISIDPSINDVSKLVMPNEGKKVTSEEYRKIVEEKLKEIRNDAGEGGKSVIIRD